MMQAPGMLHCNRQMRAMKLGRNSLTPEFDVEHVRQSGRAVGL